MASPWKAANPSRLASLTAPAEESMTTILSAASPWRRNVLTALRPLVPYPMTTTWLRILFLQRLSLMLRLPSLVSTSMVVPTRRTRKPTRTGVMIRALMRRACGAIGVMSPYPVVVSVTVE